MIVIPGLWYYDIRNRLNFLRVPAAPACLEFARLSRLPDLAYDLRDHLPDLVGRLERTEARHGSRVGEVPGVLGEADEIADRRIRGPYASKRRTRRARPERPAAGTPDVGQRVDRFERRQRGEVEFRLGFRGGLRRRLRLRGRLLRLLAFAATSVGGNRRRSATLSPLVPAIAGTSACQKFGCPLSRS